MNQTLAIENNRAGSPELRNQQTNGRSRMMRMPNRSLNRSGFGRMKHGPHHYLSIKCTFSESLSLASLKI